MNATERLYLVDSYRTKFVARVLDVRDRNVYLDRTLFHPRSDEQMSDRGTLTSIDTHLDILAVERRGRLIAHTVDGLPPRVGQHVEGRLDWDFRYQMMRMHTAVHILTSVLHSSHGANVKTTRVYPDHARIGVRADDFSSAAIRHVERVCNDIIAVGHPVRVRHVPYSHAIVNLKLAPRKTSPWEVSNNSARAVEIMDVDLRVDDGTHVASTLEVVGISFTRVDGAGKARGRLEMRLAPVD